MLTCNSIDAVCDAIENGSKRARHARIAIEEAGRLAAGLRYGSLSRDQTAGMASCHSSAGASVSKA